MADTTEEEITLQSESDVQVTAEDQEMINKFARQNARLEDAAEEMKQLQKELCNLSDAAEEVILNDGDGPMPYQLGDVFVSLGLDETRQMISRAKEQNMSRIAVLREETETIKGIMAELKSQLYDKFGTSINLEPEDS